MSVPIPILLDAAAPSGSGQVLRTALALAALTGRPFALTRVRATAESPGLRPTHREAVRAAARLCDAEVLGDEVGSQRLSFRPRAPVRPTEATFDAGPDGSATLLLQTLCWPLALAGGGSTLTLRGVTHAAHAPSFHWLALVWAPAVARLGFRIEPSLQAASFAPGTGGELTVRIEPARPMPPLDLRHRGTLREVEWLCLMGGLPVDAGDRLASRLRTRLRALGVPEEGERVPLPVQGTSGSAALVVATFERIRTGHGAVGPLDSGPVAPERAAELAVEAFKEHLARGGAVDGLLGDQLLLPAAILAAGLVPPPPGVVPTTRFTVSEVTGHLLAAAEVIRRFLDVEVAVVGRPGAPGEVRIQPPGGGLEVAPLAASVGGDGSDG